MHKNLYLSLAALIAFCLLLVGFSKAEAEMNYGEWEFTVQMEMPGMPMVMPPTVFRQCLTPGNVVPKNEKKDHNCKFLDQSVKGNTVKWKLKCEDKGNVSEATGTVTYKGDSMSGSMDMNMKDRGRNMVMKQKMSGRRLGKCK